jgi:P2-related tail formation protein
VPWHPLPPPLHTPLRVHAFMHGSAKLLPWLAATQVTRTHCDVHCPAAASALAALVHLACCAAPAPAVQHSPLITADPICVKHPTSTALVRLCHDTSTVARHLTELPMPASHTAAASHGAAAVTKTILCSKLCFGYKAGPADCRLGQLQACD